LHLRASPSPTGNRQAQQDHEAAGQDGYSGDGEAMLVTADELREIISEETAKP
jgi:hypothetical protein